LDVPGHFSGSAHYFVVLVNAISYQQAYIIALWLPLQYAQA
jgi:hypothetical protein